MRANDNLEMHYRPHGHWVAIYVKGLCPDMASLLLSYLLAPRRASAKAQYDHARKDGLFGDYEDERLTSDSQRKSTNTVFKNANADLKVDTQDSSKNDSLGFLSLGRPGRKSSVTNQAADKTNVAEVGGTTDMETKAVTSRPFIDLFGKTTSAKAYDHAREGGLFGDYEDERLGGRASAKAQYDHARQDGLFGDYEDERLTSNADLKVDTQLLLGRPGRKSSVTNQTADKTNVSQSRNFSRKSLPFLQLFKRSAQSGTASNPTPISATESTSNRRSSFSSFGKNISTTDEQQNQNETSRLIIDLFGKITSAKTYDHAREGGLFGDYEDERLGGRAPAKAQYDHARQDGLFGDYEDERLTSDSQRKSTNIVFKNAMNVQAANKDSKSASRPISNLLQKRANDLAEEIPSNKVTIQAADKTNIAEVGGTTDVETKAVTSRPFIDLFGKTTSAKAYDHAREGGLFGDYEDERLGGATISNARKTSRGSSEVFGKRASAKGQYDHARQKLLPISISKSGQPTNVPSDQLSAPKIMSNQTTSKDAKVAGRGTSGLFQKRTTATAEEIQLNKNTDLEKDVRDSNKNAGFGFWLFGRRGQGSSTTNQPAVKTNVAEVSATTSTETKAVVTGSSGLAETSSISATESTVTKEAPRFNRRSSYGLSGKNASVSNDSENQNERTSASEYGGPARQNGLFGDYEDERFSGTAGSSAAMRSGSSDTQHSANIGGPATSTGETTIEPTVVVSESATVSINQNGVKVEPQSSTRKSGFFSFFTSSGSSNVPNGRMKVEENSSKNEARTATFGRASPFKTN
ncbi:hypothetical protein Aperf_G00000118173 [Anoplocephala perfoliata]